MKEQYGLDPTHEDIVMAHLYDLDNPIRIVLLFKNATLDGCKESHSYWWASNDDVDDRSQEQQKDLWSTNPIFIVQCGNSSKGGYLIIWQSLGHRGKDTRTKGDCGCKLDIIDYEVDPYEEAVCSLGLTNGFEDALF